MRNIDLKQFKEKSIKHFGIIVALIIMTLTIYTSVNGFEITDSAYYYTLSTISQTLVAMVAFTGMFVVFRLQIIKEETEKSYKQLENLAKKAENEPHDTYAGTPNYNKLFNLGDLNDEERIKELKEFFKQLSRIDRHFIPSQIKILVEGFEKQVNKITEVENINNSTKSLMKYPAYSSVLSILISIIFLAFLKPGSGSYAFLGVGIVVAFAGFSVVEILLSFIRLLWVEKKRV